MRQLERLEPGRREPAAVPVTAPGGYRVIVRGKNTSGVSPPATDCIDA